MTEAEWLACAEPVQMLEFLRSTASDRKSRLFACACCRKRWPDIPVGGREAVAIAEQCADDLGHAEHLASAAERLVALLLPLLPPHAQAALLACQQALSADHRLFHGAMAACVWVADIAGILAVVRGAEPSSVHYRHTRAWAAEFGECSHVVRDVFGNPFRPVSAKPVWLTSTVVELARGIYVEGAFDRLPILADALQDAGCENADVLGHCRGPGPHARSCWVVDLVLGMT